MSKTKIELQNRIIKHAYLNPESREQLMPLIRKFAFDPDRMNYQTQDDALALMSPQRKPEEHSSKLAYKIVSNATYLAGTASAMLFSFRGFSKLYEKVMEHVFKDSIDSLAKSVGQSTPAKNLVAVVLSFAIALVVGNFIHKKTEKLDKVLYGSGAKKEIYNEAKQIVQNPTSKEIYEMSKPFNPDGSLDKGQLTYQVANILEG